MSVILTDDSTNCDYVLKEGKGCNLGEERNHCYIFMALHPSYHHVIYDSVSTGYIGGVEIFLSGNENKLWKC